MKTIKDLEKEYEGYKKETMEVTNLESFLSFIGVEIEDYEEAKRIYRKELRENFFWKLEAQIRNSLFFLFAEEEVEIYDLDTEMIQKCVVLIQKIMECFKRLQQVATEDTVEELTRLVDFTNQEYYAQRDYSDYERDQLEYYAKGITMFNPRFEDRSDALIEFIVNHTESAEKETPPQYVKDRR